MEASFKGLDPYNPKHHDRIMATILAAYNDLISRHKAKKQPASKPPARVTPIEKWISVWAHTQSWRFSNPTGRLRKAHEVRSTERNGWML